MVKNLDYVVEHTEGIFGFNIRTARVEPGIDKLISEISRHISESAKLKEQCLYALTSAGSSRRMPENQDFQKLREISQIKHFHVAPALWLADKCVASGCDGLVVNGFEGGGHQAYERVGSVPLLQQVQEKYPDIPKIAAGGFANGTGLALALTIVKTGNLSIIRMWKNKYSTAKGMIKSKEEKIAEEQALIKKRATMSKEELKEEYRKDFIKNYAIYEGDVDSGIVPLGQSIGVIKSIESVSDIIDKCVKDAEIALKKAADYIK
jgi:NAD(P)H-dependent flavin oxidoreductase YrpB (nitropropane dioxygenase family)